MMPSTLGGTTGIPRGLGISPTTSGPLGMILGLCKGLFCGLGLYAGAVLVIIGLFGATEGLFKGGEWLFRVRLGLVRGGGWLGAVVGVGEGAVGLRQCAMTSGLSRMSGGVEPLTVTVVAPFVLPPTITDTPPTPVPTPVPTPPPTPLVPLTWTAPLACPFMPFRGGDPCPPPKVEKVDRLRGFQSCKEEKVRLIYVRQTHRQTDR